VIGATLLVPAARTAVADLLGIGTTRIEIAGEQLVEERLPHIADGLDPVSVEVATELLGWEPPDTAATALGPPDTIYRMPEGGVLLVWDAGQATLWVRNTGDSEMIVSKLIGSTEDVEPVDDLGAKALIIDGSHIVQTPGRRLAAGTVLLWYEDGREFRLEADLPHVDMIELARGLDR
jgi:hypothetical protein